MMEEAVYTLDDDDLPQSKDKQINFGEQAWKLHMVTDTLYCTAEECSY